MKFKEALNEKKTLDDDVIDNLSSKLTKLISYLKKNLKGGKGSREDIKEHMYDFAYENHIDLDEPEADYFVDTQLEKLIK